MLGQSFSIFGAEPIMPADAFVQVQPLRALFIQGDILSWRPRIAPCSTRGAFDMRKPRVFCWVLTSDLESGGALRAPSLDPRTFPNMALRAVRLPLVELGIIVRIFELAIR